MKYVVVAIGTILGFSVFDFVFGVIALLMAKKGKGYFGWLALSIVVLVLSVSGQVAGARGRGTGLESWALVGTAGSALVIVLFWLQCRKAYRKATETKLSAAGSEDIRKNKESIQRNNGHDA